MRGSKSIDVCPPQNGKGLGNMPKGPKVRSAKEVDTGPNAGRSNRGDQCLDPKKSIRRVKINFDYELDKNGNPKLLIPMKDGGTRRIEFDQTRDKWYHEDIFSNISPPDGFDNQAVRDLDHSDKLDYLRKPIPDKSVIELQNEIGKSLSHPKTMSVPGFLGKYKIEGMVNINMQSRLVSFTDSVTKKHRTIVKMSPERIQELAKNGFHLFLNK